MIDTYIMLFYHSFILYICDNTTKIIESKVPIAQKISDILDIQGFSIAPSFICSYLAPNRKRQTSAPSVRCIVSIAQLGPRHSVKRLQAYPLEVTRREIGSS